MPEVRVFSGDQVVADYLVEEDSWDGADGEMPSGEDELVAHAKRKLVSDGHMTAEEAEGATYMVGADPGPD